jgi:hypothetical protein
VYAFVQCAALPTGTILLAADLTALMESVSTR